MGIAPNLDASPPTTQTYSDISVASPDSSADGRTGCHWIASTDDLDTGGTVEWMDPQVLYKFEIISEGSTKVELYFYECSDDVDDDPFLCPELGGTKNNDLNIYSDTDAETYDFRAHGFLDEEDYDSVNDTFSDDNWMWPLDLGTFCYLNNQKNSLCASNRPDYFLSPQEPGSTMTHTDEDLLFVDWGSNGQTVTLSGEGQNLIFTTGTSLVVEEEAELTLGPDIKLSFPVSQGVDVDGKIIIAGTSSGPVILDKSGASKWGGVSISGSGADASSIDYLNLKNAVSGVFLLNVDDVTIDDSDFELNTFGVFGSNSSTVTISSSSSFDNSLYGVRNHLGHTNLYNSDIYDNDTAGLRMTGTADLMSASDGPGLNNIYGNGTYGIWLSGSIDMGDDSSGDGGDNSIYDNTDYDAYVILGGDLKGENNWWGESPPTASEMYADGLSTLDYTPYLSSAPSKGFMDQVIASNTSGLGTDKIPGARGAFLSQVRGLRKAGQRESSRVFLKGIINDRTNEYRDVAAPLYIADLFHKRDGREASRIGEQLLADTDLSSEAKVDVTRMLFEVYTHLEPSLEDAERMINILRANSYELDLLDTVIRSFNRSADSLRTGGDSPFGKRGGIQESLVEFTTPDMSVYPNPTNSTARFRINATRAAHASIELYDILGRRVATIFNGNIPSGIKTITFDSSHLPSGSYFYRANWDQQTQSGTLILMK